LRIEANVKGAHEMSLKLVRLMVVCAVLSVGACVVYEPVVVSSGPSLQQRFERSWSAAAGAMVEQGLSITAQDRGAGVIRGERSGVMITARVETLADNRISVKFSATAPAAGDTGLIQRVSDSYDRRMGQ
jgi:hypothetical protein